MNLRAQFMLQLKVHLRFSFREHLKLYKMVKKDKFDVAIEGLLDCVTEGALEGALNGLSKDAQKAAITNERKQNVANILNFLILLIMFKLSTMQAISREN